MAVTSTIVYCTDRDLQDIFPHLSEYDLKRRVYNWQTTDTSNLYVSTMLFHVDPQHYMYLYCRCGVRADPHCHAAGRREIIARNRRIVPIVPRDAAGG